MSETILMEREASSLHVELKWLPMRELLVLQARAGDVQRAVTVPPAEAMQAFEHPCAYLPEAQDFFKRGE